MEQKFKFSRKFLDLIVFSFPKDDFLINAVKDNNFDSVVKILSEIANYQFSSNEIVIAFRDKNEISLLKTAKDSLKARELLAVLMH